MKLFIKATIAVLTLTASMSIAQAKTCGLDLSNTDLTASEISSVQSSLISKGFVSCEQGQSCDVSVNVAKEESSALKCKITLKVRSANSETSVSNSSFNSFGGDICAKALIGAVKAIPSCSDLSK